MKIDELKAGDNLTIKYEQSPDYHEFFAGGIWGGSTIDGNLKMVFFNESLELPRESNRPILEVNGKQIKIGGKEETMKAEFSRSVVCSITISSSFIPNLIEWLQDRKTDIDKRSGSNGK